MNNFGMMRHYEYNPDYYIVMRNLATIRRMDKNVRYNLREFVKEFRLVRDTIFKG